MHYLFKASRSQSVVDMHKCIQKHKEDNDIQLCVIVGIVNDIMKKISIVEPTAFEPAPLKATPLKSAF